MTCTHESHAAAKADDATWSRFILRGVQKVGEFTDPQTGEHFPAYDLHLRNCPACDSTLAREIAAVAS